MSRVITCDRCGNNIDKMYSAVIKYENWIVRVYDEGPSGTDMCRDCLLEVVKIGKLMSAEDQKKHDDENN